jgi:hypothetical protein
MKLIVLSQYTLDKRYEEISNLHNDYCLSKFIDLNIPTIKYCGSRAYQNIKSDLDLNIDFNNKPYKYIQDKNQLYINCADLLDYTDDIDPRGIKTYYAFKYLLEHFDFDILFRTNCTSYLDVNKIIEESKTLPHTKLYTGAISGIRDIWFVISAYNYISRDLVEQVVLHGDRYLELVCDSMSKSSIEVYEDICIGKLFVELGLNLDMENQPFLVHPFYYKNPESIKNGIKKQNERSSYRFNAEYVEEFKMIHKLFKN